MEEPRDWNPVAWRLSVKPGDLLQVIRYHRGRLMDSTIVGVLMASPCDVELLYGGNKSVCIKIDLLLEDGISSFVVTPHDEVKVLNEPR